jgi:hypothetical protein
MVNYELYRLRLEVQQLRKENDALKERLELQEPLFQVRIAIRRRFFEQAKELRGRGTALKKVIEAGNAAAHRGDIIADSVIFALGYMDIGEPVSSLGANDNTFEQMYKPLFDELYSVKAGVGVRVGAGGSGISVKEVELFNLTATIASNCSAFVVSEQGYDLDANRFNALARECSNAFKEMDKLIGLRGGTRSELSAAFDTCPNVEIMFCEMREIAEKVVGRYRASNGGRRTRRRNAEVSES